MLQIAALFVLLGRVGALEAPMEPLVSTADIVRSVAVTGTKMTVSLGTQVGQLYNSKLIEEDVRKLWGTGRFDDIRVETSHGEDGNAVIFHVVEARPLRIRKLTIEPSNLGVRLRVPPGDPVDQWRAHAIAGEAGKQLVADGFSDARVDSRLAIVAPGQADLEINITTGERVRVKDVQITGESTIDEKELRRAVRDLRVRRIFGWPVYPAYSAEAVDTGLARLRSLYLSQGYFDAAIRLESTEVQGKNAELRIRADAGPLHPLTKRPCDLCTALFRARRESERQGILDFSAVVSVPAEGDLTPKIERGGVYRVGRIEFSGNHHFTDAMLRRNFLLEEGQLLDGRLLRKSIDRLNRSNLFEPVDPGQVVIHPNGAAGVADVLVKVTEKKRGAWRLSGPVGPASFAGPLEASISSRLPPWGSGLFELATYTVSVSVYAFAGPILPLVGVRRSLVPVLALARPFSPGEGWGSGFSIAPQLGWRASVLSYSATQLEQRLLPVLAGDRGLVPELPVTVDGPGGEGTMICEPAGPRFPKLRFGATIAIRLIGVFTGL